MICNEDRTEKEENYLVAIMSTLRSNRSWHFHDTYTKVPYAEDIQTLKQICLAIGGAIKVDFVVAL